jgi:hypothetical protein
MNKYRNVLTPIIAFAAAAIALGSPKDDIGYTQLLKEYGSSLPDGSNITILQPEACEGPNWAPAATGDLSHRKITQLYGAISPGTSAHAQLVATNLCGSSTSILPNLGELKNCSIGTYRANSLNVGMFTPPLAVDWDVENHSVVGGIGVYNINALQLQDYRIDRDKVTVVAGLDNGTGNILPLWGNCYNTITVGTITGQHSRGGTDFDGSGRMKPDLVGPVAYTSYSTPYVASAAGFLISEAKRTSSLTDAKDPRVIKALLMAGATKDRFPAWSHTSAQPLDPVWGAGLLNIRNSYKALLAGKQPASSTTVSTQGWDLGTSGPSASYTFVVSAGQTLRFSSVLTWHRLLTSVNVYWIFNITMANLDLVLTNSATGAVVAESRSSLDNVEHIYVPSLPAGTYTLTVSGPAGTTYGLAWCSSSNGSPLATPTPAPLPSPTPTPKPTSTPTPVLPPTPSPAPLPSGLIEVKPLSQSARGENAPNETLVKLFDNSSATKWLDFAGTTWVQISFAAPTSLSGYRMTSANDRAERDPYNWTVSGSNDGKSWAVIEARTGQTFTARYQQRDFILSAPSVAYKYFRFDITCRSGSITQLAELSVLAGTPQVAPTSAPTSAPTAPLPPTSTPAPLPASSLQELLPTSISARGENGPNETVAKAFDHSASSKWLDFASKSWIQVSVGTPKSLVSYSLTSANDHPERDPCQWTISGSNDGTTWTSIETRTSESFASRFQQRDFILAAPSGTYLYYRIDMTCKSGSITQLADIELWGN